MFRTARMRKIKKYGVVSKEVATVMAKNGYKHLKSDIVVSFTGNAGPTKEPGGAEVGRVHIAILCKPNVTKINNFTKNCTKSSYL